MLEGDDDAASLLQEKEVDNLAGERPASRPITKHNLYSRFIFSIYGVSKINIILNVFTPSYKDDNI